jgi:eight-cysteine-cluster-containing protein
MKYGVMVLPLMVFLSGCSHVNDMPNVECVSDSDCVPAGCSSQLCVGEDKASDIVTTCEYREEYSCLEFSSCGCADNKCAWEVNSEYTGCLNEVRG